MNQFPKVSVVIPTYKRLDYLEKAIQSVIKQNYQGDIEIVVIDDSPNENCSLEKIKVPKNREINYIHNDKRIGLPASRNKGLLNATGEFKAFLDGDDEHHPDKLKEQINVMMKDKRIGLTYTDTITINSEGKEIRKNKALEWNRRTFLKSRFICWSSIVLRNDVTYYLDESLPSADDFDFLIRASETIKFKRVPGFLTYYRWHENSISHNFVRSTLLVCSIFIKHHMYLCMLHEVVRHLPESIWKQFKTAKPSFVKVKNEISIQLKFEETQSTVIDIGNMECDSCDKQCKGINEEWYVFSFPYKIMFLCSKCVDIYKEKHQTK